MGVIYVSSELIFGFRGLLYTRRIQWVTKLHGIAVNIQDNPDYATTHLHDVYLMRS